MIEALELELRQLDGVSFVALAEHDDSVVIELFADGSVAEDALREDALRLARGHLDRPVMVEFVDAARPPAGPGRVKLVVVLPWPERHEVDVHLAWGHRRVSASARAGDLAAVGRATVQALEQLGLSVPFAVTATKTLGPDVGGGSLVVLKGRDGELRRGIAGGRSTEESAARATLHALNRFLERLILTARSEPAVEPSVEPSAEP